MSGVGVALAIVIGLLSSFIQSLGLTIQRKSHIQNDALPLELQRTPTRRPLWLFGFGIYITSNIFATIFQLDTLPIVILAPLGAVSLIYNALLARLILGDRFGKRTIAGTALVAVGATLIAVFGVVQEEEHGIQELLRLWARPAFLGFFGSVVGLTGVVLVIAHVVSYVTYRSMRQGRIRLPDDMEDEALDPAGAPSNYASPCHPAAIPFQPTSKHSAPSSVAGALADTEVESTETTGLLAPATIVKTPSDHPSTPTRSRVRFASISSNRTDEEDPLDSVLVIQPTPAQQRTITLTGLAFAACSGVISGMSLVLAKAAVELLVMTLEYYRTGKGANQFAHPQSWFLVAGLAVGGMAQLVYLNYSLCFASPALICPLAFCFFNISSIFDGLVFYDQFSLLSPTQIGLVSTGVAVLLLGVVVVSAVQPTGEGGVEVGTWVEDESALDEEDEVDGKLPDQPFPRSTSPDLLTADHDDNESDRISEDTIRASAYPHSRASERHTQATRPGSDATRPVIEGADSIIDDPSSPRTRKPLIQRRSTMPHEPGTFTIPMPQSHSIHGSTSLSGSAVFSPNSPMSPNTAKRRRRRYGSLLPLPLPLPMPYQRHNDMPAAAGFAIGLGAASPGFMLRSEHEMSPVTGHAGSAAERAMGRGRRVRSRSEGQEAMSRLMRTGDELDGRGSDTGGRGPRRRSEEGSRGMIRQEVLSGDALNDPAEHPSTEGDAAEQTRRSSARSEGRSWWSSIFARRNEERIKLDEERSPTSR